MSTPHPHRGRWIAVITFCFAAAFIAIRSAPVEPCEVLHYGEFLNEEGAVEYCGEEETAFFDMSVLRYPVEVKLVPQGPLQMGQEQIFDLYLSDHMGVGIAFEDIVVSHTERIHLMLVDPSLQDYQHLHPQPGGGPGHYVFRMTPHKAGNYRAYLDFIPLRSQRRVLAGADFTVQGPATPAQLGSTVLYEEQDLVYELEGPQGATFQAGEESQLNLKVSHKDGATPVQHGLVMGAYAHLVVFDADGKGFAHLHPRNPFVDEQDPLNPDLRFSFFPGQPGQYRLWAQLMIEGQERFVPFDLEVVEDAS